MIIIESIFIEFDLLQIKIHPFTKILLSMWFRKSIQPMPLTTLRHRQVFLLGS